MIELNVLEDTKQVEQWLTRLERREVPFATAVAMTRSVKDGQEALQDQLRRKIDRPTRFTLKGVRIKPATKRDLEAHVFIRDEAVKGTPPIKYLAPLIYGGPRNAKRHEKALRRAGILPPGWFTVPGEGARLNRFGNLTAGLYTRILSDLRASPDPLQNRGAKGARYFVMMRSGQPIGIYERRSKKRLRSVLHFVRSAPRYNRILAFHDVADRVARRNFSQHFDRALTRALRTMRR